MSSVPRDKAGVGSAVLNSMRQVGGSLGIAIMGAVVAASVSGGIGSSASKSAPAQFVTGFHHALEVSTVIALVGALLAWLTLHKAPQHEPAAAPALVEAA